MAQPRLAWSALAALAALPLLAGLALLGLVGAALGNPLVFLSTQAEWNRAFSWPWETVINAFQVAPTMPFHYQEENQSWFYLATLMLFGALAVAGWVRGLLRPPHALYLTLGLLFPLFSATPHNPLLSLPALRAGALPGLHPAGARGPPPWAALPDPDRQPAAAGALHHPLRELVLGGLSAADSATPAGRLAARGRLARGALTCGSA